VNPVRNGNSIDEGAILEAVQPYARHFQIPEDVAFEVANMAAREDIPLEIAFRLVERESSFDPGARVRRTGAGGYTQMTPIALHELQRVGKADPELTYPELVSDPRLNLEHGFRYLRHMLDRFQGDWSKALDHYSGGAEGYADKVQGMPK
jgi:soluble lytic murein transglycosylase-like protein